MLCTVTKTILDERDVEYSQGDSQPSARRSKPQVTEILDSKVNIGASFSSMVYAMSTCRNLQEFPILEFFSELVSHLCSTEVRKTLQTVPEKIHRDCHVDDALHYTNLDQSAYETSAPERGRLNLSAPKEINTVAVNDGDGIILGVNSTSKNPLEDAVYTRLNQVEAPELYAVQYIRNAEKNEVLDQFKGHWSFLGVYIDKFVHKGRATFCFQFPRDGRTEPIDHYKRLLRAMV